MYPVNPDEMKLKSPLPTKKSVRKRSVQIILRRPLLANLFKDQYYLKSSETFMKNIKASVTSVSKYCGLYQVQISFYNDEWKKSYTKSVFFFIVGPVHISSCSVVCTPYVGANKSFLFISNVICNEFPVYLE